MEMIVSKRCKHLSKGVFTEGSVVNVNTDKMVVYHKGLELKVRKNEDGSYALSDGETVFQ